jgi:hypothetical protein
MRRTDRGWKRRTAASGTRRRRKQRARSGRRSGWGGGSAPLHTLAGYACGQTPASRCIGANAKVNAPRRPVARLRCWGAVAPGRVAGFALLRSGTPAPPVAPSRARAHRREHWGHKVPRTAALSRAGRHSSNEARKFFSAARGELLCEEGALACNVPHRSARDARWRGGMKGRARKSAHTSARVICEAPSHLVVVPALPLYEARRAKGREGVPERSSANPATRSFAAAPQHRSPATGRLGAFTLAFASVRRYAGACHAGASRKRMTRSGTPSRPEALSARRSPRSSRSPLLWWLSAATP